MKNYSNHYQQIKPLIDFLKKNPRRHFEHHPNQDVIESDLSWESARFWANTIYLSQQFVPFKQDDLIRLQLEYEKQNNLKIDVDQLFSRFWLRNILGEIQIAGSVSSACRFTFSKIKDRKTEITFLMEVYPEIKKANRKLKKTDVENLISDYNSLKNVSIDFESLITNTSWIRVKNETVEFSDIDHYLKPYLDNWDSFGFINCLLEEIGEIEKGLKIDVSDFEKLHSSFTSFHPLTPTIDTLKSQHVINECGDHYVVDFYHSDLPYWSDLNDKISGLYWELLINDSSFISDSDRILFLLSHIANWESSPDPLLFVKEESKKRFLNAAFDLVSNEMDLEVVPNEFQKICIDSGFRREEFLTHEKINDYRNYSLELDDAFELYSSFQRWEEMARTTYLHDQSSRGKLEALIRLIVKHDYEVEEIETGDTDNPKIEHYRRIISLLESYQEKPALLFDIACYILLYRREVLPALLLHEKFISFSFQLIDQFEFDEEQQANLSKRLWTESISIALITIRSISYNPNTVAKIIGQIFSQLNTEKYSIPFNRNPSREGLLLKEKQDKERLVLSIIEDALTQNKRIKGVNEEYLIPSIFNHLFQYFANLRIKPLYNNGIVEFPMLQMDGLVWLMKCNTYWKYRSQFANLKPEIHLLTQKFFDLYISTIETTQVGKWDFTDHVEKPGIPNWSERIERLQFIEWIYPIFLFYQNGKLNDFLVPNLRFRITDSLYDEMNSLTTSKLRTHLGVLIQVLQKLLSPGIPHGLSKKEISDIKIRVERQIIDCISANNKDIPEEGRVDILEYQKETGFYNSEKEALLPQIARAINWFFDRESIINAIIDSNDILKILTVSEFITSHGIKQILIEKIKPTDMRTFLESSKWIPEVHTVILKVTLYPQLMDQIIQVTEYWEKEIAGRQQNYQDLLYRTKLLIAYYRKDELELEQIKPPSEKGYIEANALNHHQYKDFYRALIWLNSEPEMAHEIFNRLVNSFPNHPVFALNRMAAKMRMADQKNDTTLYSEALEEWNSYETRTNDLDPIELGENFLINKSIILLKLERYDQLYKEYSSLDLSYQMLPGLLETKIEGLIAEKKIGEAMKLIEQAESYHKYSSITDIEFIQNIKNNVQGIDDVEELRFHYNRIFQSAPKKLIKILPEVLNGKNEIIEFVTNELALSVNRMLDKVHSVSQINKEDRFNDLVHLALESRIAPWGWSVKDQTRKAFSPSNKDLGEIDLDIQDWNKKSFVTCEAFILRDKTRVQSHLKKLIAYYTHNRKAFLVLVYCLDSKTQFEKKWTEYSKTIVPTLKYPSGYEILHKGVEDVSDEFDSDKSAIKIGKSIHGVGTPMYHVFVNIKYRIN